MDIAADVIKIVSTALLSIAALFVITKIMGYKQVSQLDFFDYVNGITIGSIGAELATDLEEPWKPLIALAVYGGVSVLLSFLTGKAPKTRKYINGAPSLLMNDGKLYRKNFSKAKLDLSEFMMLCRQMGYFDLSEIQTVVFEYNGRISILPKSANRPATPSDLKITANATSIGVEVIMDGRIMGENLSRMKLDEQWLESRLTEYGYGSAKEIFLAVCDKDKKLTLFPFDAH